MIYFKHNIRYDVVYNMEKYIYDIIYDIMQNNMISYMMYVLCSDI